MMKIPAATLKMTPKGFTFNAACMRLIPDAGYVQFRHLFNKGHLVALECGYNDEHSVPWRVNCNSHKVLAKNVRWPMFYNLICEKMGWIVGNEYTVSATLQEFDGKRFIFFDLCGHKEKSPIWDLCLSDLLTADIDTD